MIEAERGDITRETTDAIVNAANSTLLGGGGVDGAIHRAAGPGLLEACRRLRRTTHRDGLPAGQSVATEGFDLPARWVIHTVGPNWNRGQRDPAVLASCFTTSLTEARRVGAQSIAFPAISAGAYGWDVARVAAIAVQTCSPAAGVDPIRFVLFDDRALRAFEQAIAEYTPEG